MGLRPTYRNESQPFVTPRRGGLGHQKELDSRFRGNDVTFDGVSMGPRPARGNENPHPCRPRETGGPSRWIPAFAGMTRMG
jgi:hypothetical protein